MVALQKGLLLTGRILAAAVRMVEQAGTRPAAAQGHLNSLDHECRAHMTGHGPAHELAVTQIQNRHSSGLRCGE